MAACSFKHVGDSYSHQIPQPCQPLDLSVRQEENNSAGLIEGEELRNDSSVYFVIGGAGRYAHHGLLACRMT